MDLTEIDNIIEPQDDRYSRVTYEELANAVDDIELFLLGIRLLISFIPMCILLIGILVFWKLYPLTKEKILENKAKLKELGF